MRHCRNGGTGDCVVAEMRAEEYFTLRSGLILRFFCIPSLPKHLVTSRVSFSYDSEQRNLFWPHAQAHTESPARTDTHERTRIQTRMELRSGANSRRFMQHRLLGSLPHWHTLNKNSCTMIGEMQSQFVGTQIKRIELFVGLEKWRELKLRCLKI